MSTNGARSLDIDAIFSQYSKIEIEKFGEITRENQAGNHQKATQLMQNLTNDEADRFDLFIDDMCKIHDFTQEQYAKIQQLGKEIQELDNEILIEKEKSKAIIEAFVTETSNKAGSFTPKPSNNYKSKNKKCSIQ